jgi:hypothetical protein
MTAQSSSRSWFPGLVVPLSRLCRVEVLSSRHRSVRLQVSGGTVYGTATEALATGLALVRAAIQADPTPWVRCELRHDPVLSARLAEARVRELARLDA